MITSGLTRKRWKRDHDDPSAKEIVTSSLRERDHNNEYSLDWSDADGSWRSICESENDFITDSENDFITDNDLITRVTAIMMIHLRKWSWLYHFGKETTNYRALLRKMTYEDKALEPLIIGLFCGKWPMKTRQEITITVLILTWLKTVQVVS